MEHCIISIVTLQAKFRRNLENYNRHWTNFLSFQLGTMPMFLVLKPPVRCYGISHLVFVVTANNLASSNVIVILN